MQTVLVANRSEIALRILRTVRAMGLRGVAVHSDADADAPHVRGADIAVRIGPAPAADSYLSRDAVLAAARTSGADAVHPGYGFLSEDATFARACVDAGLVFVGPPADAIATMGDKIAAKQAVEKAGVPVVPGFADLDADDGTLVAAAAEVGFPLLVKAAAGGGGKGMRAVHDPSELPDALASARREAAAAFGSDGLLLERLIDRPRHVEVQVLADAHGTVLAVGERECSLQRRHQKIVEECPSPWVDADVRRRMSEAAVAAARSCGYVGAGTVEFLVDPQEGSFWFLEMNTRLQVEHPVTEEVYRLDLVAWQLRIAAGERLDLDVVPHGHAVEARVYAEDPGRGFVPTGGVVDALVWPEHAVAGGGFRPDRRLPDVAGRVRIDSGIDTGTEVSSRYDPMLAKVVAWAPDRAAALRVLDAALADTVVLGVGTNLGLLRGLLADADVKAGRLDTGLVERRLDTLSPEPPDNHWAAAVALGRTLDLEPRGTIRSRFDVPDGWRVGGRASAHWQVTIGEVTTDVAVTGLAGDAEVTIGTSEPVAARAVADGLWLHVTVDGCTRRYARANDWLSRDGIAWRARVGGELASARARHDGGAGGPVVSPMPGVVITVAVAEGERVDFGQTLVVVEAMKMEQPVTAPVAGIVRALEVHVGAQVSMEQVLAVVEPDVADGEES